MNIEVVKYRLMHYLDEDRFVIANITGDVYIDKTIERIVLDLSAKVLQTKVREEVINYYPVPANWWEHLKDYLQSRYNCFHWLEVHYIDIKQVINHYHCCPHLKVDETQLHYRFLNDYSNRSTDH